MKVKLKQKPARFELYHIRKNAAQNQNLSDDDPGRLESMEREMLMLKYEVVA